MKKDKAVTPPSLTKLDASRTIPYYMGYIDHPDAARKYRDVIRAFNAAAQKIAQSGIVTITVSFGRSHRSLRATGACFEFAVAGNNISAAQNKKILNAVKKQTGLPLSIEKI